MKQTRICILGLAAAAIFLGGCSGGQQASASKSEENAWRDPPKHPPAGYDKYMSEHKGGPPAAETK